jgi:hypothetical protein
MGPFDFTEGRFRVLRFGRINVGMRLTSSWLADSDTLTR